MVATTSIQRKREFFNIRGKSGSQHIYIVYLFENLTSLLV